MIVSPVAMQLYRAAELETDSYSYQLHVPYAPKIGDPTQCGFLFIFNSILSRDYKPVHPSPLAFILLLLENFLSGIALSFCGGFSRCLIGEPVPLTNE